VTGREDLVARYFPDDDNDAQATRLTSIPIQSDDTRTDREADVVTHVPQVGPATQTRLAGANISTAGELATASVETLETVGIGDRRAAFLIGQAQDYVADVVPVSRSSASSDLTNDKQSGGEGVGNSISAAQMAAAQDAVNNDDAARLASNVGLAVGNAMGGGVPTAAQSAQIATQVGLPVTPQTTQFLQVASAMGLSGAQAQTVIQDVQGHDTLSTAVTGSIRASLSTLTLANGGQLDSAGMTQAVGLLEGAARSLVTASQAIQNGSTQRADGEAARMGSTRPQTTAASQ
ncbi:MAG: helix-hairpin-helix domain-containing protein, partial [Chloroflexota bacterium]